MMFIPELLRHLATLSRNLLSLARKQGNQVELDALREAEEFFRAGATKIKGMR